MPPPDPPGEQVLVDCSGGREGGGEEEALRRKAEALLRIVGQQPSPKCIVFCNKVTRSGGLGGDWGETLPLLSSGLGLTGTHFPLSPFLPPSD